MHFAKYAVTAGSGALLVLGSRFLSDAWIAVLVVVAIAIMLSLRHRVPLPLNAPDPLDPFVVQYLDAEPGGPSTRSRC